MVVIEDRQQDQWAARRFVRSLGVSDEILSETQKTNPDLDWLSLVYALDRVFLTYGGTMAQSRFFREAQDSLSGNAPIEVLAAAGGPTRVCEAAHVFAAEGRQALASATS